MAKATHSNIAFTAASLSFGSQSFAQKNCTGISVASARESWELCFSAKGPCRDQEKPEKLGVAGGCKLHYSRAALHPCPYVSHVAAHSITALMAPGSKEVPTHSDAPSTLGTHTCTPESTLSRLLQITRAWEGVLSVLGDYMLIIMIMAISVLYL